MSGNRSGVYAPGVPATQATSVGAESMASHPDDTVVSIPTQAAADMDNRLLTALPARNRRNFLACCDCVQFAFAEALCRPGDRIRHAYFPLDALISLVTTLPDGERLEVGIVGNEGMLGASLALGVNVAPQFAIVQRAGTSLRIGAAAFTRLYKQDAALRQELHRYVHVLMSQLAQTAACTHYHLVEARLARWLLMTRDRARSDRLHLTHKFLAYLLGVRRVGITEAANSLHDLGLIEYSRGEILILDAAGLERAACRCYRQAKDMYENALGPARDAPRRMALAR